MKESPLETMLTTLYALQTVDSELEEIAEMKGDLPGIVDNLEAQEADLSTRLTDLTELMKTLKTSRDHADMEILASSEKIERYKSQQLQVKSNKQYDALGKEIDAAQAAISQFEKEMETSEGKLKVAKDDSEEAKKRLEELQAELEEKRAELREVNKEHEKEEHKLQQQRQKIIAGIARKDLDRYERIRKAKGGKAVVPVKRSSCGGCYNRIPPQKILELHQNNKMYMCEHCGRIIVSDEIVHRSVSLL